MFKAINYPEMLITKREKNKDFLRNGVSHLLIASYELIFFGFFRVHPVR
jgi:hypothetical protein